MQPSHTVLVLIVVLLSSYCAVNCDIIQLTSANIDGILASYELVFINFYVEWCQYSNLMQPVFDEAAQMVNKEFGTTGRVVMCRVDCDVELEIAKRFRISKYPTLKVSLNGDIMRWEYRGQRSTDALVEFVLNQLKDPIKEFSHSNDLKHVNTKRRRVIAYFDHKNSTEYQIYRRVAANLKEDCDFYAGFGVTDTTKGQPLIIFKPDVDLSHEPDEVYSGNIHADELKIWTQAKCIPLVREITFDNAEELTEEGLPLMVLFYHPNNTAPIKDFKARVEAELISEKQNINFVVADGKRFTHPLEHLDKSLDDLPVIAIDSFRHMYLFPEYNDIFKFGMLKTFVADLYSGKLHREFHSEPDQSVEISKISGHDEQPTEKSTDLDDNRIDVDTLESSPPDSTFIKLAPSEKRYTLLRNEL